MLCIEVNCFTMLLKQFRALLLPLTAVIIIPWVLLYFFPSLMPKFDIFKFAGIIFLISGSLLIVLTIRLFTSIGKGTLAPWDPTKKLVIVGPYKYTRNPMISGVFFILVGETLWFKSIALSVYAIAFFLFNDVYFRLSEEKGMEKRFGKEYLEYKKKTPRWIPRLSR